MIAVMSMLVFGKCDYEAFPLIFHDFQSFVVSFTVLTGEREREREERERKEGERATKS